MIQFPRKQNLTFYDMLPTQTIRGAFCTHAHFRVTRWILAIITDNVHVVDLLCRLDSVICLCDFSSTPVQVISNIYWRVFNIGVRTKFIFKARIFAQQFPKHIPPDRINIITGVLDFLQPRFVSSYLFCEFSSVFADGSVSILHAVTLSKSTRSTQTFHSSLHSKHQISH